MLDLVPGACWWPCLPSSIQQISILLRGLQRVCSSTQHMETHISWVFIWKLLNCCYIGLPAIFVDCHWEDGICTILLIATNLSLHLWWDALVWSPLISTIFNHTFHREYRNAPPTLWLACKILQLEKELIHVIDIVCVKIWYNVEGPWRLKKQRGKGTERTAEGRKNLTCKCLRWRWEPPCYQPRISNYIQQSKLRPRSYGLTKHKKLLPRLLMDFRKVGDPSSSDVSNLPGSKPLSSVQLAS